MNLFYGSINGKYATLDGQEAIHSVKVLRNRIGDMVQITNGKGDAIQGQIIDITKKEVLVEVEKSIELPSRVTPLHIAIAPTKNIDRFEFFIEKAIELGVSEITPIICHHSERRKLNEEKLQTKALSANTQSLRSNFAKINLLLSLNDFLENHPNEKMLMAHCHTDFERELLLEVDNKVNSIILIGPEGDFSKEEIEIFTQNHKAISLGPNRLRTETAGITVAEYFYSAFMES